METEAFVPNRRHWRAAIAACIMIAAAASASRGAAAQNSAAAPRYADPQDGLLVDNIYRNDYFGLVYRLPAGWGEGLPGAPPSYSGYYVLNLPRPKDGTKATFVMAAQDMFFSGKPMESPIEMLQDVARTASPENGLRVEHPPEVVTIAGRSFARLEMNGEPLLSRIILSTAVRCHVIFFTFTSSDRAALTKLAASLDGITLPAIASAKGAGAPGGTDAPFPVCVKDYAKGDNILHKVNPVPADPKFQPIPVRIIIDASGRPTHIHVISAFPQQKKNIEDALVQWRFKPYSIDGHPVEVETGLVFEFKPAP